MIVRVRLVLFAVGLLAPSAARSEVPPVSSGAEEPSEAAEALALRLVLGHAERRAAAAKSEDQDIGELLARLGERDRELRAALRSADTEEQRAESLIQQLRTVTAEREAAVAELSRRDQSFAADVEAFRSAALSIADSPDPAKRAALEAYADGRRVEAYGHLVAIQTAVAEAERQALAKSTAAGWTELAYLAEDLRAAGEATTREVLEAWRKVVAVDPQDARGWTNIGRELDALGEPDQARVALDEAARVARTPDEHIFVLAARGNLDLAAGRLDQVRQGDAEQIEIARGLAAAEPADAGRRLNLVMLLRIAAWHDQEARDPAAADGRLREAFEILATEFEDPSAESARRAAGHMITLRFDDAPALLRSGVLEDALGVATAWSGAEPENTEPRWLVLEARLTLAEHGRGNSGELAEFAAEARALAEADGPPAFQRFVYTLDRIATLQESAGDVHAMRRAYQERLAFAERLRGQNPAARFLEQQVRWALDELATSALEDGDSIEAARLWEQGLARALAMRDQLPGPQFAPTQWHLALGRLRLGEGDLAAAQRHAEAARDAASATAAAFPADGSAWANLAGALVLLGDVELREDHPARALNTFDGAREAAARSRALDSGDGVDFLLGAIAGRRGDAAHASRRPKVELTAREEAASILRSSRLVNSPDVEAAFPEALLDLARVQLEAGMPEPAHTSLVEAVDDARRAARERPGNATAQVGLLHAMERAGLLEPQRDGADALRSEAVALASTLGEGPAPPPVACDTALGSTLRLARYYDAAGELGAAIEAKTAAAHFALCIADAMPESLVSRRALAQTLGSLAESLAEDGQISAAMEALDDCAGVLDGIAASPAATGADVRLAKYTRDTLTNLRKEWEEPTR